MGTFQRWDDPEKPISVEEAQRLVLEEVTPLQTEEVPVGEAYGRVLREDVVAPEDVPPTDNSAMDGYAVRASDVTGATGDRPAALSVRGDTVTSCIPAACGSPNAPINTQVTVKSVGTPGSAGFFYRFTGQRDAARRGTARSTAEH